MPFGKDPHLHSRVLMEMEKDIESLLDRYRGETRTEGEAVAWIETVLDNVKKTQSALGGKDGAAQRGRWR